MDSAIQIRSFLDTDRRWLIDFICLLQAHEVSLHDTRIQADEALCTQYFEDIKARAHRDGGEILVATVKEQPVGFICFWIAQSDTLLETPQSNRYGYVSDLFVASEYRGQRTAQGLLEAAADHLRADPDLTRLRICTLAMNALAVSAYEGAGFEPFEITYEKRLR